ncbi:MAG: hypothetical protein COT74_00840 [Bdellovibrionales bacterium CG10_big_fil_rev_8_21_14_0_10_45_34]|nr:MAG: hypothetical protein COT74_00840 [Bdellovibrionales bacterium CG10_big_fil_rev_8_21_14_0_10_45_34]
MKLILFSFYLIAPLLWVNASVATEALTINTETRLALFDKFVDEIERLDGEGLPPRSNRPESWQKTIARLRSELANAKTKFEVGQVFRRLDATYPNLHAHLSLDRNYDLTSVRPIIAATFRAEIVNKGQKTFKYMISSLDKELASAFKERDRPGIGDEVLAINGTSMSEWSKQNFLFCKFPLREQCESDIFEHFRKELGEWDRSKPLTYKLRRNSRQWEVRIPIKIPVPANIQTKNDSGVSKECPVELDRYADFKVVLKGLNICVFESDKWPGVVMLRIASFAYFKLPKEEAIRSLKQEVDRFYAEYWKAKAPLTKKLIVDLIDNGGGDTPIRWYQMFLDRPFQEQYVQFKKTTEIEDADIRKKLFYNDHGHELWFEKIKRNGTFSKTNSGDFLPNHPAFCADETKSCDEGFYEPVKHGFKGQMDLLVNELCISSCTGFVWQLKDKLKSRVRILGFPDSGDSTYGRLLIDVFLTSEVPGYKIVISPRQPQSTQKLPKNALLRQQVAVTRTTDEKGKVFSGIPVMPDVWVPKRYRHFDDTWEATVFQEALKR